MIYIQDFNFAYMHADLVASIRSQIDEATSQIEGNTDPPITDDQRPYVEHRLAELRAHHVTLQIRDTYLQTLVRMNRAKGITWTNPWERVGPDFFVGQSDEDLLEQMRIQNAVEREAKRTKHIANIARRRAAKASEIWRRPKLLKDRYEIIEGRMHEVRERISLDGETVREVNPNPIRSTSICHRGKRISIVGYVALMTGVPIPVPNGPKPGPKRYRAQVRQGDKVVHLGMFDTAHERDAAVLTYRLGLGANPAP